MLIGRPKLVIFVLGGIANKMNTKTELQKSIHRQNRAIKRFIKCFQNVSSLFDDVAKKFTALYRKFAEFEKR